ncbi:MAG: MFS transporter [Gammaproteobacteria bacterium]
MSSLIHNRNLWILFFGGLVAVSGSSQVVTFGGIVGERLAENKALATLPLTMHIVGIALFTVPSAMIMRRIGRARGLAAAALVAALAQLLIIYALFIEQFWCLVAATTLMGLSTAFARQLRFVAAESVEPRFAGRAISFVLSGSIGGALLGPTLASGGVSWFEGVAHAGGLSFQAMLFAAMALAYFGLQKTRVAQLAHESGESARPLGALIRQPVFVVAVACGVVSYLVMSLIMTATPLSMHVLDGFSLEQTAGVVRTHVLGMYVPALISGWLIDKAGAGRVAHAGAFALTVCIVIGLAGHAYMHYWWSMLLLGVGWNFLYTSGTTLLTRSYRPAERYLAQAFNEFVIFSVSAIASLMAGLLIHKFGWTITVAATVPAIVFVYVALVVVRKREELKAPPLTAA